MFYNNNIIFLHIPKTSGNTFLFLNKRIGLSSDKIPHNRLVDKPRDFVNSRNTYSFIRDPYSWYKSFYSYLITNEYSYWSALNFESLDLFIESCTINKCKDLKVRPFIRSNDIINFEESCNNYSIGLYSVYFLDFIRTENDLFSTNENHLFFEIGKFYKYHKLNKRINSNTLKGYDQLQITEKSKSLIDQYDLPTYEMLSKNISKDYNIF